MSGVVNILCELKGPSLGVKANMLKMLNGKRKACGFQLM